jgi:hypothetical protein
MRGGTGWRALCLETGKEIDMYATAPREAVDSLIACDRQGTAYLVPDSPSDGSEWTLEWQWLAPGTVVNVDTRNTRYRFVVVDRTGGVLVHGGPYFAEVAPARIEGSMCGALVCEGWLTVGMPLAIATADRRIVTSRVRAIRVETESREDCNTEGRREQ